MTAKDGKTRSERFPSWLKKRLPVGGEKLRRLLDGFHLVTVCSEAHCPNQAECYARGTAAFLILGATCTRDCRFCAVHSGQPSPPRRDEPQAVARAAECMGLRHVVITSVTRDDLPDGGAGHFARTIHEVHKTLGNATIEALVPDFQGRSADIDTVLDARPDVFNHNIETVPRLYPKVRPRADYRRSLEVIAHAHRRGGLKTKSGLMAGLGELPQEVTEAMRDLLSAGCDLLTIGQYLAPSRAHVPVARFIEPAQFDAWRDEGLGMGFAAVCSGPFVRSSYHAREFLQQSAEAQSGIDEPRQAELPTNKTFDALFEEEACEAPEKTGP
jgi:lipoic acid synthetase